MSSIGILTDNSAQYPQTAFPGRNLIRVINLECRLDGRTNEEVKGSKSPILPAFADEHLNPSITAPGVEDFRKVYHSLKTEFDEILVILNSGSLTETVDHAQQAADSMPGAQKISIIDSKNISAGLGMLVQTAAISVSKGLPMQEVERLIRQQIPHIYGVICPPGLTYLAFAGALDQAQATVGEMLGLFPIFDLDEGELTPVQKVRNYRSVMEYFQEFLEEFDHLQYISLVQGGQISTQETRMLRQFIEEIYSSARFSEHGLNLPMATLFGPRCYSIFVSEALDRNS